MLLNDELKEGLEAEKITAIEALYATKETELKGLANKNADGIFNGAAAKLTELTGIAKADDEKYSNYFERLGTEWLPSNAEQRIASAEKLANDKVLELEEKIKNHKGDETLKIELQKAREEVAKIPDLLGAKETEWKTKYDKLEASSKSEKLNRAITDSMPKFDDNVNKFELDAKKTQAIDRIKKDYELSFDENGKLIGTKDYQKFLVDDLLKQDAELKDLILIDQNAGGGGGGGTKPTSTLTIPKDMAKGAAQQLIEAYIISTENIPLLDDKYSERFKTLCKENNVL